MGMFDSYEPDPPLSCPECGHPLDDWQGKNGPRSLLLWKQGEAGPVGFRMDGWGLPDRPIEHELPYRLPPRFEIYSYDCDEHPRVTAIGECEAGRWLRTTVLPWKSEDSTDSGPSSWHRRWVRRISVSELRRNSGALLRGSKELWITANEVPIAHVIPRQSPRFWDEVERERIRDEEERLPISSAGGPRAREIAIERSLLAAMQEAAATPEPNRRLTAEDRDDLDGLLQVLTNPHQERYSYERFRRRLELDGHRRKKPARKRPKIAIRVSKVVTNAAGSRQLGDVKGANAKVVHVFVKRIPLLAEHGKSRKVRSAGEVFREAGIRGKAAKAKFMRKLENALGKPAKLPKQSKLGKK